MATCRVCGSKVKKGTICDDCKLATVRELKSKFGPEKKTLSDLKENPTLYEVNFKG